MRVSEGGAVFDVRGFRLEALEASLRDSAVESDKRAAASEKTLVDSLNTLKEEIREKFGDVTTKVDSLNENLKVSEDGGTEKFNKVEANFNALQTALRDIQTDNSRKIERVVEDSRNSKDLLTWMESKIKESKVEYTGKVGNSLTVDLCEIIFLIQIHEIAHVTREQRREYKAKFLEVETDTSRMKERLETMNLMIDEIQEKLYEFEQNKKNNLIFHGILADHPETSDGYLQTIC